MPLLDLKKIITSFLVLAIAAGTVAFIFSNFSLPASPAKPAVTASASAPQDSATPSEAGLPAEALPADSFAALSAVQTLPAASSSNLTDQIASTLANKIIQANPGGPQAADNGQQNIVVPSDITDAAFQAIASTTMSFVAVPLQEEKIKMTKNYSPDDFQNYFASVKKIIDDAYVNDGIAKLAKNPSDISAQTVAAVNLVLSQTEEKLYTLAAPAPAEKIHRALLSYIVYQKNIFDPAMDSDPARSLALVQGYDTGMQLRTEELQSQMNDFLKNPPTVLNKQTGLLENIFLPKTAYALFGLGDIVHDPINYIVNAITGSATMSSWLKTVAYWAKHQALVILKQQIIHRMVMQVIQWVQGGGTPQFVTNWEGFLNDVGNNAAGVAISALAPGLCSSFGPLITLQLKQAYLNYTPPSCTLDTVINNIDNFYNSFENGGWLAYGAVTLPSGNYYGALYESQILVSKKMDAAKQSENANAQANSGSQGQKVCVDWRPLIGPIPAGTTRPKVCAEYQTLTPGNAIAGQLDKALGTTFDNIISADDIGALIDAMINSALQKLVKFSTTGLTGLLQGDQNTPSTSVTASDNTDPCVGLSGQQLTDCKNITGTSKGTTESGTDVDTEKTSLSGQVKTYLSQAQDAGTADANWLGLAPSVQASLSQISVMCPTLAGDANAALQSITALTPVIQDEYAGIAPVTGETCDAPQSLVGKFQCLQGDIISAKTADDIQTATQALNSYISTNQGLFQGSAASRYQSLQDLQSAAQTDASGSCSQPLPQLTQ